MSWCLLESDPGVFTELLESLQVKNVQVEELWSLDDDTLASLPKVFGVLFLFKWEKSKGKAPSSSSSSSAGSSSSSSSSSTNETPIFMKQVINNACGTQALLHVLLNCPDVDIGPDLSEFKSLVNNMEPELSGSFMQSWDICRDIHNSFARPEPFIIEESKLRARQTEDAFHFISLLPIGNRVYELDGLKPGPIIVGEVCPKKEGDGGGGGTTSSSGSGDSSGGDGGGGSGSSDTSQGVEAWLNIARNRLQERIQEYSSSEIRFNIMVLVRSRLHEALLDANVLCARVEDVYGALLSTDSFPAADGGGSDDVTSTSTSSSSSSWATSTSTFKLLPPDTLRARFIEKDLAQAAADSSQSFSTPSSLLATPFEVTSTIEAQLQQYAALQQAIFAKLEIVNTEKEKRARFKIENDRRRHNFVPFIMTLMSELAAQQKLTTMLQEGQQRARDRKKAAMKE